MEIERLRKKLEGLKYKKESILNAIQKIDSDVARYEEDRENNIEAREVIKIVASSLQKEIEIHITGIVTQALKAVFPEYDEFGMESRGRVNSLGCEFFLVKNGHRSKIMRGTGGGVTDVLSLALRLAIWSLKDTRKTLIFDEPLKFIHSSKLQEQASEILKEISDDLGIQLIIISDLPHIMSKADKIIDIESIRNNKLVTLKHTLFKDKR